MKISHRPLSMRLRIWQRRPSQLVEVADHRDARRVGRPDGESDAVDALVAGELRAQAPVELAMRALDQQMIVQRPEHRAEGVGVLVDLDAVGARELRAGRPGARAASGDRAPRRNRPCGARVRRSARRSRVTARTPTPSGAKARIAQPARGQVRPQDRERIGVTRGGDRFDVGSPSPASRPRRIVANSPTLPMSPP